MILGHSVPNIEWVYIATRTRYLLNNNDSSVREMALSHHSFNIFNDRKYQSPRRMIHSSLDLKWKAMANWTPKWWGSEWGQTGLTWMIFCHHTGLHLKWVRLNSTVVTIDKNIIADPLFYVCNLWTGWHAPQTNNKICESCHPPNEGLTQCTTSDKPKLQGKLVFLPFADRSLSHSIFSNTTIGEDILTFTIKAHLQVLPTKYNLATWYPCGHDPHYILHSTTHDSETIFLTYRH